MDDSGNYSVKELHRSRKTGLKLKVTSKKSYSVARFTMYIVDKDENIQAFQSSSLTAFELNKALSQIDSETAIYFDDIIVNIDEKWFHLMERFSFVFE